MTTFKTITKTQMSLVLAAACAVLLALCIGLPQTANADQAGKLATQEIGGPNLTAAKAKYGVDDSRVIVVEAGDDVAEMLNEAGYDASAAGKYIVYAPAGSYAVQARCTVPSNVILVGESTATFKPSASTTVMISVQGSIYGGYFDGANTAQTVLRFSDATFDGVNGVIENATITQAKGYGIVAMSKACRNSAIIGCKVVKNGLSGISILNAAQVRLIDRCDVSDNKTAGINLSHADVAVINACTVNRNGDKGISTNSEHTDYDKAGCDIGTVSNCVFDSNAMNGVYLKPFCTMKAFTGNTLKNNKKGGLSAMGYTDDGLKGPCTITNVSNNTFIGSGLGQVRSIGKGAKLYMGSNNKITSGKVSGLEVSDQGVMVVKGNNNKIQKNKGAGVNVSTRGKLTMTGKGNVISNNKKMAIYCVSKGKVTIKKAKVKGRIYKNSGGKVIVK